MLRRYSQLSVCHPPRASPSNASPSSVITEFPTSFRCALLRTGQTIRMRRLTPENHQIALWRPRPIGRGAVNKTNFNIDAGLWIFTDQIYIDCKLPAQGILYQDLPLNGITYRRKGMSVFIYVAIPMYLVAALLVFLAKKRREKNFLIPALAMIIAGFVNTVLGLSLQ